MDVAHKAKLGVTPDASPNHPTHGRNKHHRLPPHSFPWSKLGDHVCHMSQRSNNKPKTNWEHSNIYQDFNPPLEGYVCVSYLNHARLWAAKKSKEKPLPLWRFSRTNRCLSLCHILVEPPWWYLESHPKSLVTSKHSHPFNVNMVDFFGPTNIYVQLSTDKLINPQTHGPTGPRPVGCWSSICAWEDERSWSPVSVWALLLEIYANDYIINSKQTLQMDSMDVNYWWLVVDDILSFPVLHCKYFLPTVELHPSYQ